MRSILFAFLALLTLPLCAADSPGAATAGSTAPETAEQIIGRYNGRNLGQAGARRIELRLINQGVITRTFETVHAWQRDQAQEEIRSLVLLEKPKGLRGTTYLLVEGERPVAGMEVFLHLAAGQGRVLSVLPGRFDEGLLGSDFGYTDLLWHLPTKGRSMSLVGEGRVAGQPVWKVDVEPKSRAARESTTWGRVRYYLQQDPVLLVGADFFAATPRGTEAEASKRLRVYGWEERDEVWTPVRMVMTLGDDRESVLTLQTSFFNLPPFDLGHFEAAQLPAMTEALLAGALPDFMKELSP